MQGSQCHPGEIGFVFGDVLILIPQISFLLQDADFRSVGTARIKEMLRPKMKSHSSIQRVEVLRTCVLPPPLHQHCE